jgi:4-oxalocrotonate tautomerase
MMPRLNLTISPQLREETVHEIVTGLTRLTKVLLNKQADVTRIHVSRSQCFVGGNELAEPSAFDLSIYITKGTNTDKQKEKWIHEVNRYLGEKLGGRQRQPDYITIHEIPPQNWGYGGISMATKFSSTS